MGCRLFPINVNLDSIGKNVDFFGGIKKTILWYYSNTSKTALQFVLTIFQQADSNIEVLSWL